MASVPAAVQPEALRPRLVSCLAYGRSLVLSFGSHDADVHALLREGLFPEVGGSVRVLRKTMRYK